MAIADDLKGLISGMRDALERVKDLQLNTDREQLKVILINTIAQTRDAVILYHSGNMNKARFAIENCEKRLTQAFPELAMLMKNLATKLAEIELEKGTKAAH